jgi:hypothetical protein
LVDQFEGAALQSHRRGEDREGRRMSMENDVGSYRMQKPALKARARESGSQLLAALERLLRFPQNQDSTDLKLYAAIRRARKLVSRLRPI